MTTRWVLAVAVAALYFLHQDFWFWDRARPLVFGFLPIGFFYHAVYSVAVAGLMWGLIRFAWPGHLEVEAAFLSTCGCATGSVTSTRERR